MINHFYNREPMDIRQIKTLVNILDICGFAAARDTLGLTQTKKIRKKYPKSARKTKTT